MPEPRITNKNGNITVRSQHLLIQPSLSHPCGIRIFVEKEKNNPRFSAKPSLEVDSFDKLTYIGDAGDNVVVGLLPSAMGKIMDNKGNYQKPGEPKVPDSRKSPIIEIYTGGGNDFVVLARSGNNKYEDAPSDPDSVLVINTGSGVDTCIVEGLPGSTISYSPGGKDKTFDLLGLFTKSPDKPSLVQIQTPEGDGKTAVRRVRNSEMVQKTIEKIIEDSQEEKEIEITLPILFDEIKTLEHDGALVDVKSKSPAKP